MKKTFCDKCKKCITDNEVKILTLSVQAINQAAKNEFELCPKCYEQTIKSLNKLIDKYMNSNTLIENLGECYVQEI